MNTVGTGYMLRVAVCVYSLGDEKILNRQILDSNDIARAGSVILPLRSVRLGADILNMHAGLVFRCLSVSSLVFCVVSVVFSFHILL